MAMKRRKSRYKRNIVVTISGHQRSQRLIELATMNYITKFRPLFPKASVKINFSYLWLPPNVSPTSAANCASGRVHDECISESEPLTCSGRANVPQEISAQSPCFSGCRCENGNVLLNDMCVPSSQCPCEHNGNTYQPGETTKEDCRTWWVPSVSIH